MATRSDSLKVATVVSHTTSLSQAQETEPELLTNEILVGKDPGALGDVPAVKGLSLTESHSVPSTAAVKQELSPLSEGAAATKAGKQEPKKVLNLTEMEVMDAREEGTQTEADPGMEGVLIGQGKADETPVGSKLEEKDDYDQEEQVVGGDDSEKQQPAKQAENLDKNLEDELADYNGDDENEGEFEADKQAELAQV